MHLFFIAVLALATPFASGAIHVNKDLSTTVKKEAFKANAKAEYKVNP